MKCLAIFVLSIWVGLATTLTAHAQAITPVYFFTNGPANPEAPLTLGPDGSFYGTTSQGGTGGVGTVFRVATNGMWTTLVNFDQSNGANPQAGLTLGPDGGFYGTTTYGGSEGFGTVFKVTTNGTLTTLVNFTFGTTNGTEPAAGLTLGPDGSFYGTTSQGGSNGNGTVFKVTTNGTLTTLASFNGTNGADPAARLTLGPDGNFYGTTVEGGSTYSNASPGIGLPPFPVLPGSSSLGYGTVFQITTNGTLTMLFSFNSTNGAYPRAGLTLGPDGNFYGTTSELDISGVRSFTSEGTVFKFTTNGTLTTLATNAGDPYADLTLGPDGNLYGTTRSGGGTGNGSVFMVTTNGAWTTLFALGYGNTNGSLPQAALTLGPDGNFYGTTSQGGIGGLGTVFQLTTNGAWTTLVSFVNPNGSSPNGGLTLGPDGNFYGTTAFGGIGNDGTLFKVTTNGTLTTLVNFNSNNASAPQAGLTLGPDGNLYGTTEAGGFGGEGTVFQVTTNGMVETLVNFYYGTNGYFPMAGLTLGPDGNFYGTTSYGGSGGEGTVYQMTTNDTLTTLVSFNTTNGANPQATLTLGPDGNFYGTTSAGGGGSNGTVFMMTTNGTLTTLVNFNGTNGGYPQAALTLGPDGNFYGTTTYGGSTNSTSFGYGTVFRVTTNGTLTTLVSFNFSDGANPQAGLTLGPDGNLYGTTSYGGTDDAGTVFQVTTNGTLTTLVNFNPASGINPSGSLTLGGDGNFYGATHDGGSGGGGNLFQLELPPDFITAPASQTAIIGGSVTFNCRPFGTAPFAYQWLSNGVPIVGATNATLTLTNVTLEQVGAYSVIVGNSLGSVQSPDAILIVQPALPPGPFFAGEASLGNNWYYLAASSNHVFGYYSMAYFPYVYHDDLGFEYYLDANNAANGAYFYDFTSSVWWYTEPNLFPYLYDFSRNAWLYYSPDAGNPVPGFYTSNPRWFYDFSANLWTTNMAAQ